MLEWLFTTEPFRTREASEHWAQWLVVLWQVQNGMTSFSYAVIGGYLVWFWSYHRKTWDYGRNIALWLAMVFFMCAWVRMNEVLAFHWPAYHLFVMVAFLTCLMAAATAIKLPAVVIFFVQVIKRVQEEQRLRALGKKKPGTDSGESA